MTARYGWGGIRRLAFMRIARLALLAALVVAALPAAVLASEPSTHPLSPSVPGGVAATPARIELAIQPGTSEVGVDVAVTNRGPQPAHVQPTLADLVVTQAGAYETAPAGQTPYSLARVAHLGRDDLELAASNAPGATATVHVTATIDQLDRPLYGALTLELAGPDPATLELGGVRVAPQLRPSILIPIVFVPLDAADADADGPTAAGHLAESIRLQLQGASLSVGQRDQSGWLDRAIPVSLPGIADHGPLVATAGVHNAGNAFGRAFTTYAFAGVNPLAWLPEAWRAGAAFDEHPFLNVEAVPAALMPDMAGETHAATTYVPGPGAELDATPWFGLVQVRATTSLVLADFASDPVVQETYVLVAPWKEALTVAVGWGLWRLWRARRRRPAATTVEIIAAEPTKAA
jgi:hypothetical protein